MRRSGLNPERHRSPKAICNQRGSLELPFRGSRFDWQVVQVTFDVAGFDCYRSDALSLLNAMQLFYSVGEVDDLIV